VCSSHKDGGTATAPPRCHSFGGRPSQPPIAPASHNWLLRDFTPHATGPGHSLSEIGNEADNSVSRDKPGLRRPPRLRASYPRFAHLCEVAFSSPALSDGVCLMIPTSTDPRPSILPACDAELCRLLLALMREGTLFGLVFRLTLRNASSTLIALETRTSGSTTLKEYGQGMVLSSMPFIQ
jgi:hypothetical protein